MKKLPLCLNGEKFVQLSLCRGDGHEEEHPQLLVQTQLLPSLSSSSLSVYQDCGVSQTPEQAQRHLVAGLSALCKDRMEGPNGAHCILSGMLDGLGARRSVSWGA